MKATLVLVCLVALMLHRPVVAFAPAARSSTPFARRIPPFVVIDTAQPGATKTKTTSTTTTTSLAMTSNTKEPKSKNNGGGPVVNLGLLRQTVFTQILIGWTIWTGGGGAQVLQRNADFNTEAILFGIAGVIPLILLSQVIERSENPAVADLNLSTNMLVLRLFGDKPQPVTAFLISAPIAALTGLVEETTFRGQVLPELASKFDNSLVVGIVLSTLLFAALHVNPLSLFKGGNTTDALVLVAYQIVTGFIFAMLYVTTNNLAVPVISHALFDFYVFFAAHLVVTTQMEYARNEATMPVAPRTIEAKWRQKRGDDFLLLARETFYLADSNRDGVLSREELRIALYSYGIRLSTAESAAITQVADVNQSGTIDFAEFLEFVGPTGSPGKAIKNSLLGVSG